MNDERRIEKRKTSLLTRFVFLIVLILFLGEGLVLGGLLELNTSTVERCAPWAYESFLHLIGEHPAHPVSVLAIVEEGKKEQPPSEKKKNATGLSNGLIPVLMKESPRKEKMEQAIVTTETNAPSSTSNAPPASKNTIQKISPTPSPTQHEKPVG